MNVGAIALLTGGALLMHASLTAQSPLADLKSIFTTGKVGGITGGTPSVSTVPGVNVTQVPSGTPIPNTGGGTTTLTKPPIHILGRDNPVDVSGQNFQNATGNFDSGSLGWTL